MRRRSYSTLLDLGRPALGTWSQMHSAEAVDMVGEAGFDFTIIDCEHGAFGIETAENLMRACDAAVLVPLVRAPSADPRWIGRALDAGAAAVVVPGVPNAETTRTLVAAARFAPSGSRGACPCVRAGGHYIRDWRAYASAEDAEKGIIALVETAEGLADIDAICAVDGLLGLVIGPFDLSVSLGYRGDYRHRDVVAALDRMMAAAARSDLPVIAPIFDPDERAARAQRDEWLAKGAKLLVVGTDKILFSTGLSRYAGALRD